MVGGERDPLGDPQLAHLAQPEHRGDHGFEPDPDEESVSRARPRGQANAVGEDPERRPPAAP